MIHFPLLNLVEYQEIFPVHILDVGPPTAGPFCPPRLFGILLRGLYHLPELNRTGESVQARSFIGNNCHQNQCITKLLHSLADLSVLSWAMLTFVVRFWSLSLHLSPSRFRPASQPLNWHYIFVQTPGKKNRRDSSELKKQEANKYPRKITDPCY